jgi:hypothetical protein
MHIWISHT